MGFISVKTYLPQLFILPYNLSFIWRGINKSLSEGLEGFYSEGTGVLLTVQKLYMINEAL